MSRQSSPSLILTFVANGSVSPHRAVGFDGGQASISGQKVLGVSPRAAVSGQASDAVVSGTTTIESGGAFAAGGSLIVDVQGRAVASTGLLAVRAGGTAVLSSAANGAATLSGADLPEFVFADALEASSGAGQFLEVLLRR